MLIRRGLDFTDGGGVLQAPSVTADEAIAGGPDPRMTYVIAVRGIKSYPKPTGKNAGAVLAACLVVGSLAAAKGSAGVRKLDLIAEPSAITDPRG